MPKINTYSNDVVLSGDDKLLGTDADQSNATMNFKLSALLAWVQSNALVVDTFDTNTTLTNEDVAICTGDVIITLPSKANRTARPLTVKSVDGTVTLSEEIEGIDELFPGESITIATDGTNWYVI